MRRSSFSPRRPIGATPPCRRAPPGARRGAPPGSFSARARAARRHRRGGPRARAQPALRPGDAERCRAKRPGQRDPLRPAALPCLGVRASAGAGAPSAARGDPAPRRRPRTCRERAPRPARAARRGVARRRGAGDAGGASGYAARWRPGGPRRGPQPRPRPARACLAASARGGVQRRHPRRDAGMAAHLSRASGAAAPGAGLRAPARPAGACGFRARGAARRAPARPWGTVFGSDHHPLLANVSLHPPEGTAS